MLIEVKVPHQPFQDNCTSESKLQNMYGLNVLGVSISLFLNLKEVNVPC